MKNRAKESARFHRIIRKRLPLESLGQFLGDVCLQRFFPVRRVVSRPFDLPEIQGGMGRTRADRILRVGEVLFGRDRAHPVTVTVGLVEHRLGDIGPAFHAAGTGQIVRAVPGLGIQQVEDRVRHVLGEREAPVLVVHHGDPVQRVPGSATRFDSIIIVLTKLWPSPITQLERRM